MTDIKKKILIVMWYGYSRRASSLSKELNCELLLIDSFITKNSKIRKYFLWIDYILKTFVTLRRLIKINPDIVISTSPPSFCPIICYIYIKIFGKKMILDAHNSAFLKPWISVPFYRQIIKKATLVLIHNIELYNFIVKKYSGNNFFVLPDPLPQFVTYKQTYNEFDRKYFLVILSFSPDEPINLIFNSIMIFLSRFKSKNFHFYITGNYKKKMVIYNKYKDIQEIQFLGFIDEKKFEQFLVNSFAVISFSTKQMVQQSAVIESLGAVIPVITENSKTNQRIFTKGAILTELEESKVVEAFEKMIENHDRLKKEIIKRKSEYYLSWKENFVKFLKMLY